MSIDRRQHSRVPLEIDLAFDNDVLQMEAILRDLSLGGVNILTDAPLPVGTKISIQLHTKPTSLLFAGRVRRVVEEDPDAPEVFPSMAVQFLEMDEAKRTQIINLLAQHGQTSIPANTTSSHELAQSIPVVEKKANKVVEKAVPVTQETADLEETVIAVQIKEELISKFEETVQYAGAPVAQESLETSQESTTALEMLEGTVDIGSVMPTTIQLATITTEKPQEKSTQSAEETEALQTIQMPVMALDEDSEAFKTMQMPIVTAPIADNAALETLKMPVMTEELVASNTSSEEFVSGTMPSVEVDFGTSSATLPAVSKTSSGSSSRKKKRR